jgi:hypothetical protein
MTDISRFLHIKTPNGSYFVDNPIAITSIETTNPLYSLVLKHVYAMYKTSGKHMVFKKMLTDFNKGFGIIQDNLSYNIITETMCVIANSPPSFTDHDIAEIFFRMHNELVGILDAHTGPAKLDIPQIINAMNKNSQFNHHIEHSITFNGLTIEVIIDTKCYQLKYRSID